MSYPFPTPIRGLQVCSLCLCLYSCPGNRFINMPWSRIGILYNICSHLWPISREGNGTPLQYSCLENQWMEEPGMKKQESSRKNIYFWFIDYARAFDCVDHNKLWKILKEMGIQDHLTWLLRNLYAGQEATIRTGHGTTDWFQIRKGVCQGWILSPCLLNFYAEYIMRNAGLKKHKLESRLPGEISITSDMQMTPPLWQKVKRN